MRPLAKLVPLGLVLVCAACATPATRIDNQAQGAGYQRRLVTGTEFLHVVYESQLAAADRPLHIYLDGDGSPWLGETRVSDDPTPRRPYALELMALDSARSAYVGRPCYHGQQTEEACEPTLWTHRRYSPQVVDSLAAAILRLVGQGPSDDLILIGYSGGGALAMLLAHHLDQTRAVVTIAANLDTDAWTEHHGYSPLQGSSNPARLPPLSPSIRQLHLAGGRDQRVPAEIVEAVSEGQPASQFLLYPDFDHTCCWTQVWPEVLSRLAAIDD